MVQFIMLNAVLLLAGYRVEIVLRQVNGDFGNGGFGELSFRVFNCVRIG